MGFFENLIKGAAKTVWNMAEEANNVRHSASGMSQSELKNNIKDAYVNKDPISFAGYTQAYKDKYGK